VASRTDRSLEDAGLPPLERSAWVEVDIDQLVANSSALRSHASPGALGAVVKADGYGHGLEMAARCAVAGGAEWLCVADAGEAIRLRSDGYEGRVLVLYPVPPALVATMAANSIDVTVGSFEQAQAMGRLLSPDNPTLAVHVEIDTGMTRGGVAPGDALNTVTTLIAGDGTTLGGVWTHLAAPEAPATAANQLSRFDEVISKLVAADVDPGVVHAAASGGMLACDTSSHDLVRPGLAYYGLSPDGETSLPSVVGPALSVRALPVRIAQVAPGTAVGYAGTWIAVRQSTIVTLPIGYADGWSRVSSPGGFALVHGERAPLVGRVSSDSLAVDVTGVSDVSEDSVFTLLGVDGDAEINAEEVADVRGTITWEVLQQLGSRLSRVYTSRGSPVALRPESSLSVINAPGGVIPAF
jgi:alanine racemase